MKDKLIYAFATVCAAASLTSAAAWYIVYWPEVKCVFKEVWI